MFNRDKKELISPVKDREFIWLAEYFDDTWLYEFDSKKENSFYDIEKDKLIRFGFIGQSMRFYFEKDGIFKLNDVMYELCYDYKGERYSLTGNNINYTDIIQFKEAVSDYNPGTGISNSRVVSYNFGYKVKLFLQDKEFNFKVICKIPLGNPVYLNIRLVSNKDIDGNLSIRKNNREFTTFAAPLRSNMGGELNWVVK